MEPHQEKPCFRGVGPSKTQTCSFFSQDAIVANLKKNDIHQQMNSGGLKYRQKLVIVLFLAAKSKGMIMYLTFWLKTEFLTIKLNLKLYLKHNSKTKQRFYNNDHIWFCPNREKHKRCPTVTLPSLRRTSLRILSVSPAGVLRGGRDNLTRI